MELSYLFLAVPPLLAVVAAWFGWRAARKGARRIDLMRAHLVERQAAQHAGRRLDQEAARPFASETGVATARFQSSARQA
ncbi:hypothetical protein [Methylobacterium soli]|uniref:Uncharacterized protein n=2 Tax=Methylobacterium soli TaxID=553447 RepID=A0A6L3SVJ8_9HYPH|nr:hypothetical protein [Methylobacterium soli]KAB1077770.1 hypothetical protein F6X53_17580 [Methylobacterium soli]